MTKLAKCGTVYVILDQLLEWHYIYIYTRQIVCNYVVVFLSVVKHVACSKTF